MTTTRTTRHYELDHLRVLATFGVILLHVGAIVVVVWRDSSPDLISNFNIGNAANAAGRFAVNCFFMASGALLLDPVRRFVLRPQFLRVALPTLTWIVIYGIANVLLNRQDRIGVRGALRNPEAYDSPQAFVRGLLADPAAYHLWFVYALLAIYLVVPLLRAITARPEPERLRLLLWFLLLWFVADLLLRRWSLFFLQDRAPTLYSVSLEPLPTGYVGLFVLGYVLFHYRDRIAVPSLAWLALAAAGVVWTFVGVWQAAASAGPDIFRAYGNFYPPVLLYSVGVFGFVVSRKRGRGPAWPLVRRLSELSFRIYLVHVLVMHTLRVTTDLGTLIAERPVIGLPVLYVCTVAISVLVAWLLDLVTPLRRWI